MKNTPAYEEKKRYFSSLLTVYGRKPVLEALSHPDVQCVHLHLCDSNKPAQILDDIEAFAKKQNAIVKHHDRNGLSRISKNKKQDQGVAADVRPQGFETFETFSETLPDQFELIALDRVTTPQNLGMIIRSITASPMTGILLPEKGCAKLDALVIKASAGTLFKARIIRCKDLSQALKQLRSLSTQVYALDLEAEISGFPKASKNDRKVFVLGNETEGLSAEVKNACSERVKLSMANGVESLNVAVTAGLIAFRGVVN